MCQCRRHIGVEIRHGEGTECIEHPLGRLVLAVPKPLQDLPDGRRPEKGSEIRRQRIFRAMLARLRESRRELPQARAEELVHLGGDRVDLVVRQIGLACFEVECAGGGNNPAEVVQQRIKRGLRITGGTTRHMVPPVRREIEPVLAIEPPGLTIRIPAKDRGVRWTREGNDPGSRSNRHGHDQSAEDRRLIDAGCQALDGSVGLAGGSPVRPDHIDIAIEIGRERTLADAPEHGRRRLFKGCTQGKPGFENAGNLPQRLRHGVTAQAGLLGGNVQFAIETGHIPGMKMLEVAVEKTLDLSNQRTA